MNLDNISWNKQNSNSESRTGPHPHYDSNLAFAREFCKKTEGKLPNGLAVTIGDSGGAGSSLKATLVMVSWNPPMTYPSGNFAEPIFLHQDKQIFKSTLRYSFNQLWGMSQRVWNKIRQGESSSNSL